jgi:NADPH:quinone reductase-like Zn-dependent oxidoreductase
VLFPLAVLVFKGTKFQCEVNAGPFLAVIYTTSRYTYCLKTENNKQMAYSIPPEIKALLHDPKTHKLTLSTIPTPTATPSQYLVRVHAVGITRGELLWEEPLSLPTPIPALDVAGTVIKSPSSDSKFKPGDEVYAMTTPNRPGNAREITTIEESELAATFLDPVVSATVPMSALTAWQALFVHWDLEEGENREGNKLKKILIIGASGAVGIWAVQLGKWAGAQVVGTCGPSNVQWVKDTLGADDVLNYGEVSVKEWIGGEENKKFDFVLDCVGGKPLREAWTAVKSDGLLISIADLPEDQKPNEGVSDGARGIFFIVEGIGKQLEKITEIMKTHNIHTQVDQDKAWKFSEYGKAFERVESGRARGKVILSTSL